MKRYRVERGESVEEVNGLKEARLIAGEWDAVPGCLPVFIIRQRGLMARWRATLEANGRVRLDPVDNDDTTGTAFEADRQRNLGRLIDREDARRRGRFEAIFAERLRRSLKFGKGVARKVVCLSSGREFPNIVTAATWAGVPHTCIIRACQAPPEGKRRRKAAGMEWVYKSELEGKQNA